MWRVGKRVNARARTFTLVSARAYAALAGTPYTKRGLLTRSRKPERHRGVAHRALYLVDARERLSSTAHA